MINYSISDSKTFNYSTDYPITILIKVYEFDSIIYSTEFQLNKDVSYFTSLVNGWYDKKVIMTNKNDSHDEVIFEIKGIESNLSIDQKNRFRKYVKNLFLKDTTDLCDIMIKHGSDKGARVPNASTLGHNYTRFYSQIFEKMKLDEINFFELGLGTNNINVSSNMGINGFPGASIFGWAEYFKNGHIFGADIDTGCLFNTDKIKTFYCDQTQPWIVKQMWDNKYLDFQFDVVIEDGLHTFDANVIFFENSYHKLKKHGIYIIEDVNNDEIPRWLDKFEEYKIKFSQFDFEFIQLDCYHNKVDNNLIKITYKNV